MKIIFVSIDRKGENMEDEKIIMTENTTKETTVVEVVTTKENRIEARMF